MLFRLFNFLRNCRKGPKLKFSGAGCCGLVPRLARNIAKQRFISKIDGSLQELEESEYWLKLLGDSELGIRFILYPFPLIL